VPDQTHILMTAARQVVDTLVAVEQAQRHYMFALAQWRALRVLTTDTAADQNANVSPQLLSAVANVDTAIDRFRDVVSSSVDPADFEL
jgi:hypothetical protein